VVEINWVNLVYYYNMRKQETKQSTSLD